MMSYVKVRPIHSWPNPDEVPQPSRFEAPWSHTVDLLLRELDMLDATDIVLEMDVTDRDVRNDGWIRADCRPATSRVKLSFVCDHGPLVYATGRFTFWQHNVRAIALGLEALRKVDRYGITDRGQQYAGWKQLTAGAGDYDTRARALQVVAYAYWGSTNIGDDDVEELVDQWDNDGHDRRVEIVKEARRCTHPDVTDGDRTLWDALEAALSHLGWSS